MEDLDVNDLNQLVLFYKNKSVELEMQFLLEQLKYRNMVIKKDKERQYDIKIEKENAKDDLSKLEIKNQLLLKELEKYKKSNTKNK
jgi:hypothetical protein